MALETKPAEDAILARLKQIHPRWWAVEVPPGTPTPAVPYGIVYFGGPIRAAGDHHITSVKNDTQIGYCTVQTVSSTYESARAVNDRVRKELTGFIPPDCGEMIPEGSMTYARGTDDVAPTKYYRETGFTYRTNLSWNE